MAQLTPDEALARLLANEQRFDDFINLASGHYVTTAESGSRNVSVLQQWLADLQNDIESATILASSFTNLLQDMNNRIDEISAGQSSASSLIKGVFGTVGDIKDLVMPLWEVSGHISQSREESKMTAGNAVVNFFYLNSQMSLAYAAMTTISSGAGDVGFALYSVDNTLTYLNSGVGKLSLVRDYGWVPATVKNSHPISAGPPLLIENDAVYPLDTSAQESFPTGWYAIVASPSSSSDVITTRKVRATHTFNGGIPVIPGMPTLSSAAGIANGSAFPLELTLVDNARPVHSYRSKVVYQAIEAVPSVFVGHANIP